MISASLAVPVASVLLIYLVRMKELATKRNVVTGLVKEHWTLPAFVVIGTVMLVSVLVEFFWRERSLFWPTFLAGWALAIVSFVIRRWAIAALGRFWSLHVEIRADHELVRSGPFHWVRHPTYLSMTLELVSAAVILNAWYSLLLVPLCFFPALRMRLRLEETALVEKFGEAYRNYQRTPALFPYKLPART